MDRDDRANDPDDSEENMQKKAENGFPVKNVIPEWLLKNGKIPEHLKLKHRNSRRAFFHDYCAPGYYLITATAYPGFPVLSKISDIPSDEVRKGEMIIPNFSPLGELIKKEILEIPLHHPEIKIIRWVIMPDHLHIVLNVTSRLKRKLGKELAGFFGACSKHCNAICNQTEYKTLFRPFYDTIIYNAIQLDRAIKYVEDNPRRLIIKRKYPDLFKRYLQLQIGDNTFAAYGNIFLLREIFLLPVRIHRRWSKEEFETYKKDCRMKVAAGAIPISPAIHKIEKEIMKEAIEAGSAVIILRDQGFENRFKPTGKLFDLCAEGKLLMLAPWPENIGRKSTSGYNEFHKMNDFALMISNLPADARLVLKMH